MPAVWRMYSSEILGEVVDIEPRVEKYVAMRKVEKWLRQGKTAAEISRLWNQGHTGKCSAGTNKWGVEYDSCAYQAKVLSRL